MAAAICYNCLYGRNVPPDHKIETTQKTFCYYPDQEGNKDPDFTCAYWENDPYLDGQGQKVFPYRSIASKFMGRGMTDPWADGLSLCYPYRSSVGLEMRTINRLGTHLKCYPYRRKTAGPDPNWGGLEFRTRSPCIHYPPLGPDPDIPFDDQEPGTIPDPCFCDNWTMAMYLPVLQVDIKDLYGSVGTWCHPEATVICEYYNLSALNGTWFVPMVRNGYATAHLAKPYSRYYRGKDCCNWLDGMCANPTVYWGIGAAAVNFWHAYCPDGDPGDENIHFTDVQLQLGGSIFGSPGGYAPSTLTIHYDDVVYEACTHYTSEQWIEFTPSSYDFFNGYAPPYSTLNLKNLGTMRFSWPERAPDYDACYKLWNPTVSPALPFWQPS